MALIGHTSAVLNIMQYICTMCGIKNKYTTYVMQMAHRDCGNQSDDSSSGDEELTIPTGANVQFSVNEGTPGLQIRTRYTSSWTPIASRTRSSVK